MNVQESIAAILEQAKTPPHVVRVPCRVRHVRDADTITVVISGAYEWAIRLHDCWAPEKDTPKGRRAMQFAKDVLDNADVVEVEVNAQGLIDASEAVNPLKVLGTFDRLLGKLWIDKQDTLNEMLVRAGHATRTKAG